MGMAWGPWCHFPVSPLPLPRMNEIVGLDFGERLDREGRWIGMEYCYTDLYSVTGEQADLLLSVILVGTTSSGTGYSPAVSYKSGAIATQAISMLDML